MLSIKEYVDMIRPYLRDIINDNKTQGKLKVDSGNKVINYRTQGEWKIQLSVKINFMFPKDSDEIRTLHTNSGNTEILIGNETNEIIEERLQEQQEGLEKKMRGSNLFFFDSVDLLYYKLHKISLNRGGAYIDSPEWLKKQ